MTDTQERLPTLDIYRPILNVGREVIEHIELRTAQLVHGAGIPIGSQKVFKFNRSRCDKISMVLGGAIIRFHRINELPLTEAAMMGLENFLNDELPDSVDDTLVVPAFPPTIYTLNNKTRWVNLGADPRLETEAGLVQDAISRRYPDATAPEPWHDHPEILSLQVASVTHERRANRMANIVAQVLNEMRADIPSNIEYGGLCIEPGTRST